MALLEKLNRRFPLRIEWHSPRPDVRPRSYKPGCGVPVAVFDKDSCYADTTHRQHMVPEIRAGRATWTDYSLAMANDTPIEGTVRLLEMLDDNHLLLTVTNANVEALPLLGDWLRKHEVPMDGIVMRPPDETGSPHEFKVRAVKWLQEQGYDVRLFVDDWAEVAAEVNERCKVPVLVVKTEYLADSVAGV